MGIAAFIIGTVGLILLLAYDYFSKTYELNKLKLQFSPPTSDLATVDRQNEKPTPKSNDQQDNNLQDPITELPNWKIVEDRLNQNIKESERYQFTLAVMFIDIDNFKVINDALGYEIGDALLHEIAMRLQTCIRKVDSIGRFAKDTFVAVLTQLSKPETAAIVAQRMLQTLQEPYHVHEHELFIVASIGIALYPADGQDAAVLLRSCDEALHLAKENGKHTYQFYQEDMYSKSRRTLALYTSLSHETILEEFVPSYQPIIDVQSELILAMDASFDWHHFALGKIHADEIMSVAEKQSKLNMITAWQLKHACKQFLHWQQLGFNPAFITVPVMMEQLSSSHFIYQLSKIMQDLQFQPNHLMLNIKGNLARLSFEVLEKAFNMLGYLGIKLCINDFGSGLFPLRYLKKLHVDYLKLDRAFTDDIVDNQQAQILLKSVLLLAENMALTSIVQSIESEQQVAMLKNLGCRMMQGHILGVPLSDSEVQEKMTEI